MPQDAQDKSSPAEASSATLGRTFRGESSPPVTTPEAVAAARAATAEHAGKPGAVGVNVYFAVRGVGPIAQASMLAYTSVRFAPPEVFDQIFAEHNDVPALKPVEESKRP